MIHATQVPDSSASDSKSVPVPSLKDLTFEEASKTLFAKNLTVRKVDQPGKGVPGTALYQDPFAGRRVPPGTQVSLYVIPKITSVQQAQ